MKNYETFLPLAPAANRAKIPAKNLETDKNTEILGGTGHRVCPHLASVAIDKLNRFRGAFEAALGVTDEDLGQICELRVASKEELVRETHKIFQLKAVPGADRESDMEHASLAGCGVTAAFLSMYARIQAENSRDDFNEDLYRDMVGKSLPTVLTLAATSREADAVLTASMMNWSLKQVGGMDDEDVYAGIEFDESFFSLTDEGAVLLKNDKQTRKRARLTNGERFDFSPNKNHILFGCPFWSRIPKLYAGMTEAIISNGIAEQIYTQTQQEIYLREFQKQTND